MCCSGSVPIVGKRDVIYETRSMYHMTMLPTLANGTVTCIQSLVVVIVNFW